MSVVPQRADRMPVAELHGRVDVGGRGDALLEHADGLETERDTEAARCESGAVPHDDGNLADRGDPRACVGDEFRRGGAPHHDLDELTMPGPG